MLSVIVPTYNRNDLLRKCLNCLAPSIQKLEVGSYEVIVTDDSEKNIARPLVEDEFPWARWVEGSKKGPAANRNRGASFAQGNWLVFTDDDCLPDSNILTVYSQSLLRYSKYRVFEGCTLADRPQSSFIEESPINDGGGYLWSCNFMIEKQLFFDSLEGFDEQFPHAAMEDVDLNYRLTKMEVPSLFVKEAIVIHPWREQKNMYKITLQRFESELYFLKKHPEKKVEINSIYYARVFLNNFIRDIGRKALSYKFKGITSISLKAFMNLYFSFYMLFKK